jgi:hypothetical protein
MAVFENKVGKGFSAWPADEAPPPEGTFLATCIDIKDEFAVTVPKFENPAETEVIDRTAFRYGFRDTQNVPHTIGTRYMKISGNEKSNLYLHLRSWLGKPYPYGSDYTKKENEGGMLGRKALITINLVAKKDGSGSYPSIVSISPVPTGYTQHVADVPPALQRPAPATPPAPPPAAKAPPTEDQIPF